MGVGIGLGLLVFKSKVTAVKGMLIRFIYIGKSAPILFTTGVGLGMAYSEGSQMARDYA